MKVTSIRNFGRTLCISEYKGESYDASHMSNFEPEQIVSVKRNGVEMNLMAKEIVIGDEIPDDPIFKPLPI